MIIIVILARNKDGAKVNFIYIGSGTLSQVDACQFDGYEITISFK